MRRAREARQAEADEDEEPDTTIGPSEEEALAAFDQEIEKRQGLGDLHQRNADILRQVRQGFHDQAAAAHHGDAQIAVAELAVGGVELVGGPLHGRGDAAQAAH